MGRAKRNRCLKLLRHANARLERFFARVSQQITLHPQEELDILLQVERTVRAVGALLSAGVAQNDELVLRKQLARYRANMVRLRHTLASMQAGNCECQGRLFIGSKRVNSPSRSVLPPGAVN
jgi:hypothetical protein